MTTLQVPGARLYYQIRGSGPLLLMIHGANGSSVAFKAVAEYLAARCSVVTYDRRGFSRSHPCGPQDYDHRLETDADDIRRLIEHVTDQPATVLGSSSRGIIALAALAHHSSVIRTMVVLEAPLIKQLVLMEGSG